MTITQQIITVVVVVLGTMTTRFLPFIIFPEGKEPPAVITYLGKVLPCAVIGLLMVFCLKDVPESTHYGLPVTGGAWKDTAGVITGINMQKQTVTINVELFGRETPVEISFTEIKKAE